MNATADTQDEVAVSLWHAVAAANRVAQQRGWNVADSHISVTQAADGDWEVNYVPRQPAPQRGGDLHVEVDAKTATVKRVLRGQ